MKKLIFALLILMFAKCVYAESTDDYWLVVMLMKHVEFISQEKKTGFTPLRVALLQDLSMPFHAKTVGGIDLGIISTKVNNVYGLQLALLATSDNLIGLQTGIFAVSGETLGGIQLASVAYSFSDITGMQLSLIWGVVEGKSSGAQISVMSCVAGGDSTGLQLGGLSAYSEGTVMGVQIAGIATVGAVKGLSITPIKSMGTIRSAGLDSSGISISAFTYGVRRENEGKYGFDGLMLSGFNITNADIMGAQVGAFNFASAVKGVQIGVLNYATELSGVQIGAINIAKNAAVLVLPVINFSF